MVLPKHATRKQNVTVSAYRNEAEMQPFFLLHGGEIRVGYRTGPFGVIGCFAEETLMRLFSCLCVLLGVAPWTHTPQEKPRPELESLVVAERRFAKMSIEKGFKEAFLANLTEEAVLFRPQIVVKGRKFYQEMPVTKAELAWEPVFADISAAGDLGYTTGPWSLRPTKGQQPSRFGHYVSVWKKQPDGTLKVVLDVGISHPQAAVPPLEYAPASGHGTQQRVYREGQVPVKGEAALKLIGQIDNDARQMVGKETASSGDLSYEYGYVQAPGEKRVVAAYLRIWRVSGDRVQLALDLENPIPANAQPSHLLTLQVRRRSPNTGTSIVAEKQRTWEPSKTALIICDMWDKHWCPTATARVNEMVPRMNKVVEEARKKGVLIIHAPSECMKFYADTPQRKLAKTAPQATRLAPNIDKWSARLPLEPKLPIDDSDGGCDCDPAPKPYQAWTRQHPGITIVEGDAMSDSGVEIWNLLESRGLQNVILMGVHTNMCVLGRPFGLRQMAENGKNVVLVRDLTDAMYNPKKAPFVSHRRGTELVIEHIEQHVCGTIHSADLLGERQQPHVVFVIGENEYQTEKTLPEFARKELEPLGVRCTFIHADPQKPSEFRGLEAIKNADLVVLSVRRRGLPENQLALIRQYLAEGRPLVGIRTASHAFDPKPTGGTTWPAFDTEVLGAKYLGHYANKPPEAAATIVQQVDAAKSHPILYGLKTTQFKAGSHLYKNRDLAKTAFPLLMGHLEGKEINEPVAWTNTYKGGRIFYTSLGSPADFELPAFRTLLRNGILWGLDKQVPR
jgi:nicotinamidase-related amidase/type 1 glutamine amidotransferase/ketosteroid isomerase-like protein